MSGLACDVVDPVRPVVIFYDIAFDVVSFEQAEAVSLELTLLIDNVDVIEKKRIGVVGVIYERVLIGEDLTFLH